MSRCCSAAHRGRQRRLHTGGREDARLGKGYRTFRTERELLLVLPQSFAASSDPAIGPAVRERFGGTYRVSWRTARKLAHNQ
ncbi:hypothetical protein ACQP0C_28470 [Nocardia sp. CA-129566]|uniref:hypothetical protein n=1 Tax=Nocardia sp. CA-129566 TaxID=3239976 RepID=UPI003D97816F